MKLDNIVIVTHTRRFGKEFYFFILRACAFCGLQSGEKLCRGYLQVRKVADCFAQMRQKIKCSLEKYPLESINLLIDVFHSYSILYHNKI